MPDGMRQQAEAAFGRDFSRVRIHSDSTTHADVAAIGAIAATSGTEIHLGAGAPPLESAAGRQLLFHELTHVTQHSSRTERNDRDGGRPAGQAEPSVSHPGDAAERAAGAVAAGLVPASSDHGSAGTATIHRQNPAPFTGVPPVQGVPPGLLASRALASATGRIVAGGTTLGEGTFIAAPAQAAVVGTTTTVAPGVVTVGGVTVAGEGTAVVGGGTWVVGGAAAVGVVALGALVVAGAIYVIVSFVEAHKDVAPGPNEEYPGNALPGGAPPPVVIAPPAGGGGPVVAPGATKDGPVTAPGGGSREPVTAPGPGGKGPVQAPGVVEDPDMCLRLVKAQQPHWHHIFPREYVNEFESLGINIDDFTVKLPWNKHIGRKGIHINLDWNGAWGDFFHDVPNDLTDQQRKIWFDKAIDLAIDLMQDMRVYLNDKTTRKLVKYGKTTSSPTLPPKKPAGK